jgi:hypothetical protein
MLLSTAYGMPPGMGKLSQGSITWLLPELGLWLEAAQGLALGLALGLELKVELWL